MTNTEFANKITNVLNYKTLYVYGGFGMPLTEHNKARLQRQYTYNRTPRRDVKIKKATPDTFAFDCVNLIKGVLWGWCADTTKGYGGATYNSNGVPDIGADTMFNKCTYISRDFSKVLIGAVVWMQGHIGVYIGDNKVVECSPKWQDGVQITYINDFGTPSRKWTKWGKLPYIDYSTDSVPKPKPQEPQPTHCTYTKGEQISIKNRNAYASAYSIKPFGKKTGTYFIYDGKAFNKHYYRVTCKKEWCGKNPASKYTSFYIKRV